MSGESESSKARETPFPYQEYFGEIPVLADLLRDSDQRVWLTSTPSGARSTDILMYLGCNILRTMHLVETVVDLLKYIDADFAVLGGPANCCGIIHHANGDVVTASKISTNTVDRFAVFKPNRIVTWCPSCMHHLDLVKGLSLPAAAQHFAEYLIENLDKLKFSVPLHNRVAVHGHAGYPQQVREFDATKRILSAIPGVEVVPLESEAAGGMHCSLALIEKLTKSGFEEKMTRLFAESQSASVDTVCTVGGRPGAPRRRPGPRDVPASADAGG